MTIESLYKISNEYQQVLNESLFNDELSDETVFELLDNLKGGGVYKSKNMAAFILNTEAEIEAIKKAEKRISEKRRVKEKRINFLRSQLLVGMQKIECDEIKADDGTFTIKIHAGRKSIRVIDESVIPENFFKVTKEVRKSLIDEAMKRGEEVKGVEVITSPFLTIR